MVSHFTRWSDFVKMPKTWRMPPAMAAGVSDRLWSIADLAAMIDAAQPKPAGRGPCAVREASS
jgi:hypothetical protein